MSNAPVGRAPRRVVLLGLLVGLLVTLVAGCAEDSTDTSGSAGGPEPAPSASAEAFPVTISQDVGDVSISEEPQRVVALDFSSADAALALGIVPVGMAELSYLKGGVQEWTAEAIDELGGEQPELFATEDGFPFETLARLKPDVILATNTYPLVADSWDRLNEIAPVVAHVGTPGQDEWQDGFEKVSLALGQPDEGERVIAETAAAVQQAAEDHPEFEGRTATFFNYGAEFGLYAISNEDDASIRFIRDLGFAGITDAIAELDPTSDTESGRAVVSTERYELLDADVILGTTSGPDASVLEKLGDQELFARVPAVERGSYLPLGIGPATSMAFPSVLSVEYGLEEVVPDLAEAVAAGSESDASPQPSSS